jgi:hypothetical protein
MLRLPMPSGIVYEQQVTPAPSADVEQKTYFSSERVGDMVYAAALFAGSVVLISAAAGAAPAIEIVFAVGGGLGAAYSFALGLNSLTPSASDEQLHELVGKSGLFTPALFLTPAGAVIGGENGIKVVQDLGGVAWDVFTIGIGEGAPKPLLELLTNKKDVGLAIAGGYVLYRDIDSTIEDFTDPDQWGSAIPNSILLHETEYNENQIRSGESTQPSSGDTNSPRSDAPGAVDRSGPDVPSLNAIDRQRSLLRSVL